MLSLKVDIWQQREPLCNGEILSDANAYPDSKVHGANMGPTWDLSAPDGPHVGPMNLAIRVAIGPSAGKGATSNELLKQSTSKKNHNKTKETQIIFSWQGLH